MQETPNRIKELREGCEISQARLAAEMDVHQDSVIRWEKGGYMTAATMFRMADYFGVSVDHMMGRDRQEAA